jgi:hypothetical protein
MPTRRDFAITVGAAALGACVRTPPVPPAPSVQIATTPPATTPAASPNDALADTLTTLVRQRYGAHLTDDQLQQVRDDVRDELQASDRLRAIILPNATAPDVVFSVYRGNDR